jgi:predicted nucleic acid-binding protein
MPSEPRRIYWDSCLYISCIERTPGRCTVLDAIIEAAKARDVVLVASALVLAEVVKIRDDFGATATEEESKLIASFFENDFISVRALDRKTAEDAREISRQFGLKPPDAIHVATACRFKCECLQTYDGEDKNPRKLLAFNDRIGTPRLRIELPSVPKKEIPLGLPFGQ